MIMQLPFLSDLYKLLDMAFLSQLVLSQPLLLFVLNCENFINVPSTHFFDFALSGWCVQFLVHVYDRVVSEMLTEAASESLIMAV
jgi:hypothetical protein